MAEKDAIKREAGVATEGFPESALDDAERLEDGANSNENLYREDLLKRRIFTIDPRTAKDLDDALSVSREREGEITVGVHIADVSAYVQPGTELDKEAQRRGTSVYLMDEVIPMLPPKLSEDLCSLKPGQPKLAVSAEFRLDEETGDIIDERFFRCADDALGTMPTISWHIIMRAAIKVDVARSFSGREFSHAASFHTKPRKAFWTETHPWMRRSLQSIPSPGLRMISWPCTRWRKSSGGGGSMKAP